jgi:metal-responsive CopG/Arc/MetJ family transcriptional regulator
MSIPNSSLTRIDIVVNDEKYGYQNRSDFVLETLRKRLRELGVLE